MVKNNSINAPLPIAETKGGTAQTSYAKGDILYASASNTLSKLAIGGSGDILVSNGSIPVWGTTTNYSLLQDDFIGNGTATEYNAGGWTFTNISGTALSCNQSGMGKASTNPGVHGVSISASGDEFFYGAVNTSGSGILALGGGAIEANFLVRMSALSSAVRFVLRIGLGDTITSADQANGCYFEYTDNVNSGNWQIKTASGSTRTTNNSSTPAATGFVKYTIKVNAAGNSVSYFINDSQLANSPIATNIPTTSISPFIYAKKSGTVSSRTISIDYYSLYINLTNTR